MAAWQVLQDDHVTPWARLGGDQVLWQWLRRAQGDDAPGLRRLIAVLDHSQGWPSKVDVTDDLQRLGLRALMPYDGHQSYLSVEWVDPPPGRPPSDPKFVIGLGAGSTVQEVGAEPMGQDQ